MKDITLEIDILFNKWIVVVVCGDIDFVRERADEYGQIIEDATEVTFYS